MYTESRDPEGKDEWWRRNEETVVSLTLASVDDAETKVLKRHW